MIDGCYGYLTDEDECAGCGAYLGVDERAFITPDGSAYCTDGCASNVRVEPGISISDLARKGRR